MIEVGDVLKKGERLPHAVERLRHRLRELDADAHRARSSPFPSSACKERMIEQVETIAARGTPSVDGLVEHFGNIAFAQHMVHIPLVAMGEKGTAITGSASGEVSDALAFTIWLNKAAVVRALEAEIDREADDANALSVSDRELRLAEIGRDRLATSRIEAALVWAMQAAGDAIEHRRDADVAAVLGIQLEAIARAA